MELQRAFGELKKLSEVLVIWLWNTVHVMPEPKVDIVTPKGVIKGILHFVPVKSLSDDKDKYVPGFAIYGDAGGADVLCYRPQSEWWFCPPLVNAGYITGLCIGDLVVWRAGASVLTVNGGTYHYRDVLKQHSCRWDPDHAYWYLRASAQTVEDTARSLDVACPSLRLTIDNFDYSNIKYLRERLATVPPPGSAPPFVGSQVPKTATEVEIVTADGPTPLKLNVQRSVIL